MSASSDWFVEPDLQHQACGVSDSQKALELRQGYSAYCKLK